jgi:beta-glucanase (GH16 family)
MTPVPVGALIFADDFAGTAVDTSKWNAHSGHAGQGLGYWNGLHNVTVSGGQLIVTAVKNGSVWDSAFLTSKPGWSQARYLETRAQVAGGVGTWSGPLWEWPYPYGGAPGIENDVVEQLGRSADSNHNALHYWQTSGQRQAGNFANLKTPLAAAFHVYGSAVYPDHIDYFVDGRKVWSVKATSVGLTDLTKFKVAACVQLNMGGWAGTPTIPGPVSMLVDYVHVYAL